MVSSLLIAALLVSDPTTIAKAHERLREGQRLMAVDEFSEATRAFEAAIALDPLLFTAHYGLGAARMALKEYAAAIVSFEAARTAFHDPAASHAARRAQADESREARIRQLDDKIYNTRPEMRVQGRWDERKQDWIEEKARLEKLRGHEQGPPQLPAGLSLALGSAYFRTGRLADAEREYRAVVTAQPKLGEPRSNLAVVLLLTGRPAEAKEQLVQAKVSGFKPPRGLEADIDKALASAPATPTPPPPKAP
jgi:tetratricopeptide (TPR) repeat protein